MMYRPKDWKKKPYELQSASVKVSANQVVEFMKKVDSNTMLCHGRDTVTMDTFMGSYGKWNEWKDVSKYPVDTQDFFKKVQAELDERR